MIEKEYSPRREAIMNLVHKRDLGHRSAFRISLYSLLFKRFFDFVFSLAFIFLLSPLLLIFYFLSAITSSGSAFYYQSRMGLNGKEFYIIKFRSMYNNSEDEFAPKLSYSNDPRVTKWGKIMRKFYIDELPQLINILKGEMSFVGPRPERSYFVNKIDKRGGAFSDLFQVRPGLTSLGQIKFGYASNVEGMMMRLKYEKLYLKSISFWTDLKIVFLTIIKVIKAEGI